MNLIQVIEKRRVASPCVAPQALAWDGKNFWLSSRDLGKLYRLKNDQLEIAEEIETPGIVWAGVLTHDGWRLTVGEGLNDDRQIYRYTEAGGFAQLFACPEFTGSYLSYDGEDLYLSQWYKGEIHRLDNSGSVSATIQVEAEICGHTFVDGLLYVLRGREGKDASDPGEEWRIARLDPRQESPAVEDLATIPFASRSLTHDGERFWSNHRAANEIVAFTLPR